jgi:hypothetical protein
MPPAGNARRASTHTDMVSKRRVKNERRSPLTLSPAPDRLCGNARYLVATADLRVAFADPIRFQARLTGPATAGGPMR